MQISSLSSSVAGYPGFLTTVITYVIPGHFTRTAYLPASPDGNRVLSLLKICWEATLFRYWSKCHTGQDNVLVWNVHLKTNLQGGAYGYPDAVYLKRVTEEMKMRGVE